MKIALGCDSAGKPLMDVVEAWLRERDGVRVTNLSEPEAGAEERYAEMTERVARRVVDGEFERAILMCGTGLGVCISANKVPGIRAALAHDTYSAERAALSNNAQIITLGARVVGPELAKAVVATWLEAEFDPNGRSAANVAAIDALDESRGAEGERGVGADARGPGEGAARA